MLIGRFIFSRSPKHNLALSRAEAEPTVVLQAERGRSMSHPHHVPHFLREG